MMKQWLKICSATVAAVLACGLLAACAEEGGDGGDDPAKTYYTVTYDANGGTMSADTSVKVEAGKSVTLPEAVKDDADLTGWYNGTTLVGAAGDSYTPTASVTLTAQWEGEPLPDYASVNYERAVGYGKLINELYWNSETKLSKLTPSGGTPYLWPFTEQVSMVNGILLTMDKEDEDYAFYTQYLEELIEGLRHYRVSSVNPQAWGNEEHYLAKFGETDGTANAYAIYNSGRNDSAIDSVNTSAGGVFFDDNVWVAKEFYYAYVNTGKAEYFNEAVNILNWIVGEGYESTEGLNGIYWNWAAKFMFEGSTSLNDSTHASLNACSSAPTAMMLAKVYQTMTEDAQFTEKFAALAPDYLSKAQNIYEFCYSVLRNPTNGCLRDKVFLREGFEEMSDLSQQIQLYDEQILPYNTGTYMTAGAELYNIAVKQDKTAVAGVYLDRNTEVAAAADRQFANTQVVEGQYSYNSNSWFTSFLLEGFIDLSATVEECSEYIEHMRSALDYAWNNNRAEDNLVCPAWITGWDSYSDDNPNSEGNPRQILLQSANAHCYAMLARYYAS